jgi:hypothetical protein
MFRVFLDNKIPGIMAVPNDHLVMSSDIRGIFNPIDVMTQPWPVLVNNYFICPIQVKTGIPWWQDRAFHPDPSIEIPEYMFGY